MKGRVSIPQAVSTVATPLNPLNFADLPFVVSIPQAVSTVATLKYSTLSGLKLPVSIPQAVSTVATVTT